LAELIPLDVVEGDELSPTEDNRARGMALILVLFICFDSGVVAGEGGDIVS
jgi:hypothetical protein